MNVATIVQPKGHLFHERWPAPTYESTHSTTFNLWGELAEENITPVASSAYESPLW